MPTPVGHALGGLAVYIAASGRRRDRALATGAVLYALVPDLDFLPGLLGGPRIHHYLTHSLGCAAAVGAATYALARWRRWTSPAPRTAVLTGAYVSHLGLDLLGRDTAPPFGIQLLWPLSHKFVISPVLLFDDIWRGSLAVLFGMHNWIAVGREVLVLLPLTIALWLYRRRRPSTPTQEE